MKRISSIYKITLILLLVSWSPLSSQWILFTTSLHHIHLNAGKNCYYRDWDLWNRGKHPTGTTKWPSTFKISTPFLCKNCNPFDKNYIQATSEEHLSPNTAQILFIEKSNKHINTLEYKNEPKINFVMEMICKLSVSQA